MPDAVDGPDEGEAALEEDGAAPVPMPRQTTGPPELKPPEGASAGDNGATIQPDPGDEGFGELTEAQRYEKSDALGGDDPDRLRDD
jgi:hypothetical protein